jgi:glyoxylase-like metal-dependent hydrolase (beta-lactamase superfamily II)
LEIAPGVHKVDGVRGCNVYLLVDDALTLVDTGLHGNGQCILRYIRGLKREPRELTRIVLTHGHPDHTGSVSWLKHETGAQVYAHSGDVRQAGGGQLWASYASQPFAVRSDVPLFHRVPVDNVLQDGDVFPSLGGVKVVHTPGHTPGSVCLLVEREGVLLTGDMLLAHRNAFNRPLPLPGYEAAQYERSLERLARLHFRIACGGHGTLVSGCASERLQAMICSGVLRSYLRNLRYRVWGAIGGS